MPSPIPDDLYYSREHEWLRLDGGGAATIGITSHAQDELGDIVYVELPADGDAFGPGDVMGSVESVKAVSEIYSPVAGTVTAANLVLEAAPERINEEPYGGGWLVQMQLEDEAAATDAMLSARQYADYLASSEG